MKYVRMREVNLKVHLKSSHQSEKHTCSMFKALLVEPAQPTWCMTALLRKKKKRNEKFNRAEGWGHVLGEE